MQIKHGAAWKRFLSFTSSPPIWRDFSESRAMRRKRHNEQYVCLVFSHLSTSCSWGWDHFHSLVVLYSGANMLNSSPKMTALSILGNNGSYKSRVLESAEGLVCWEVKVAPLRRQQEKAVLKIIDLVSLVFDVFHLLSGLGCFHSQKLVKTIR